MRHEPIPSPADHWLHIRTTNAIQSTFSTARLTTANTRGRSSRSACVTMALNLDQGAGSNWRRRRGSEVLRDVIAGVVFVEGESTRSRGKIAE